MNDKVRQGTSRSSHLHNKHQFPLLVYRLYLQLLKHVYLLVLKVDQLYKCLLMIFFAGNQINHILLMNMSHKHTKEKHVQVFHSTTHVYLVEYQLLSIHFGNLFNFRLLSSSLHVFYKKVHNEIKYVFLFKIAFDIILYFT